MPCCCASNQLFVAQSLPHQRIAAQVRESNCVYVPAVTVPADTAPKLLDHTLRSKRDAEDLVTRLELNQLNR